MIDHALEQKPADFDALLKLLSEMAVKYPGAGKSSGLKRPAGRM